MNKKRKLIIQQNEISQIYTFNLGGYSQKVLIEGKNKDLPIVISLHGGPGFPVPFSIGCRGMLPEFTNHFMMVYWDQLGCGINNHPIDDHFTISSFVDMGKDLINEIIKLFPTNKIYLFSMSWGSVLSAKLASMYPDKIDGVIACGQIIKELFFNDEVITTLESSKIPKRKLEILKNTTYDNATFKELELMSSCLRKYTDAYNNSKGEKVSMSVYFKGLITSPDYKLKDVKAVAINGYKGNKSLWDELLRIDLSEVLSHIKIPYKILQGDTDIVASTKRVIELVDLVSNDNLSYCVVENSGHIPDARMVNTILDELKKMTCE